ncbi:hypothetical protein F5B20DRAFT_275200 [Whalleya microplaca]|nr:hypothetical protein F5B20DRAFT_275200 [Whalleya microplaca]
MLSSTLLRAALSLGMIITKAAAMPAIVDGAVDNKTAIEHAFGSNGTFSDPSAAMLAFFGPPSTPEVWTTGDRRSGPNDRIPYEYLPKCYAGCFDANCCNAMGGIDDIRALTVHEWCHSKYIWVGNWLLDHLQWCVGPSCKFCRPGCVEAAHKWHTDMCG